jgi:capsular exopolysaccharide synthesis family protein
MKGRFGSQHESVRQREALLQAAKNDSESTRNDVLSRLLQEQAGTLKGKYDRTRDAEAQLLARVTEVREAAIAVALKAAEYREKEQDYRRVQALLDRVMDGLERLRIAAALSRANIRVSQWPMPPFEPSNPKLLLYIPAVILFSLMLGFGLCLLVEFMDTRLRTPAEVVRQVGVPLLGTIPDLAEDERLSIDTNIALVSHTAPQSLMAEAFRHFRTSLLFASDRPVKTLLVTSPSPGDGKSSAAANLAIAMAHSGAKVLLVEANYRRPTLARVFDIPDAVGLSNILVGLNVPEEAIRATVIENLDVLPGGPPPPSPADLLGSDTMQRFLDDQTRRYDHIVIDGAPVLVVADIHLLAEAVDAVVLVFRAGENSRGLAQRAARQVIGLRARLLGAVLNCVRATKGGYFRQAYQAYYEYSGSAAAHAAAVPSAGASRTVAPSASPQASSENDAEEGEADRQDPGDST